MFECKVSQVPRLILYAMSGQPLARCCFAPRLCLNSVRLGILCVLVPQTPEKPNLIGVLGECLTHTCRTGFLPKMMVSTSLFPNMAGGGIGVTFLSRRHSLFSSLAQDIGHRYSFPFSAWKSSDLYSTGDHSKPQSPETEAGGTLVFKDA